MGAVCPGCNEDMLQSEWAGCTVQEFHCGERIWYGAESHEWRGDWSDWPYEEGCPDCGVDVDQPHHFTCEHEECPVCHGQALSCGHVYGQNPSYFVVR